MAVGDVTALADWRLVVTELCGTGALQAFAAVNSIAQTVAAARIESIVIVCSLRPYQTHPVLMTSRQIDTSMAEIRRLRVKLIRESE